MGDMVAVIESRYPKGENGRLPTPLETLQRLSFMQQGFGHSDPALENALYDHRAVRLWTPILCRMRRPWASFVLCWNKGSSPRGCLR